MSARMWMVCGALLAAAAVGMGAFGAHGLKDRLQAAGQVETFETAARYHMYHALALVLVGLIAMGRASLAVNLAGACFVAGIVLFSCMLYAYALGGPRELNFVVPVGGTLFIIGWLALAVCAARAGVK